MQQGRTGLQREQKKPVSFSSDGTPRERQALHAVIRVAYGDLHCPVESKPVIQMKNKQWDGVFVAMLVKKLHSLYLSLSVSVDKVFSILQEPIMQNQSEEEVWQYLRRFVGNMTVDELRTFLRFVTGSFIISDPSISVSDPWMVLHGSQLAILARPCWSSQVRTHRCQHLCQSSVLFWQLIFTLGGWMHFK